MHPDRWRRIDSVLHRIEEAPKGEHPRLVDELCGEDVPLRREVESLLSASYEVGEGFLADLAAFGPSELSLPDPWIGRQLGPYVIRRELGRGGTSTVYVADRADGQYDRRVAVKILHCPRVSARRSRREAQILVDLDHPNVARLLDSGSTHGHPFFVMELVEGLPIDLHCDRRRLTIRHRVELFLQVCEAVRHAHQRLVVHRDLKPGNILVTEDGVPKLLDFGIAKLLPSQEGKDATTETRNAWLTPGYASPEQLRGEAVDTRTDVFSLGLVLCRLVAGATPYRLDSSTPAAIERILDRDWPLPSQIAARADEDVAKRRSRASPASLRKALADDIDATVAKALCRDPSERYASVEALADDLRRHLTGFPVLAVPPNSAYRFLRFVKRERLLVSAIALVLLLAVGATTVALLLARQKQEILAERDRSEAVSSFLVEVFDASNPAFGESPTTARDLLLEAKRRFEDELSDQPEIQIQLLTSLVDALHRQGLYEEALEAANGARRISLAHFGPAHSNSSMLLAQSASLYGRLGEYQLAERLSRAALLGLEAGGADDLLIADVLVRRAALLTKSGDVEEAETLFRRAVEIYREHPEPNPAAFALGLHELGLLVFQRRDLDAAESLARESLAIWEDAVGSDHPDTLASRNQLAYVLLERGSLDEAEAMILAILESERRIYDDPHPVMAFTYSRLAKIHRLRGEVEPAERWFRRALDLRLELLGDEHPAVAVSRYKLAELLVEEGNVEEAEALFQKSLAVLESKMPQALITAHPLSGLGRILLDRGETKTARVLLRRALELRKALPETDPQRIETEAALARCRKLRDPAPATR